jgi:hypothetical protein
MKPYFYSPFKDEKKGLPKIKTYWNFIQSNTRMVLKKVFGILKGQ